MPRSNKGLRRCHKSGTGNNQGRRRTTPRNNRGFNSNKCHSKSIKMSLPVISVSLPLNNSVINPPQVSSVCQQSKSNEMSATVIPMLPLWNDPVINPTDLSLVSQQSSSSSHNTTHELQSSSIPGRTSPDPSSTMLPLSTTDGNRNIYGFMVDVSKLTPAHVMLLQHYHELCYTNDPSSMFVSPPPILKIESLSKSTISSLDRGSFDRNRAGRDILQPTTSEVSNTERVMAYK